MGSDSISANILPRNKVDFVFMILDLFCDYYFPSAAVAEAENVETSLWMRDATSVESIVGCNHRCMIASCVDFCYIWRRNIYLYCIVNLACLPIKKHNYSMQIFLTNIGKDVSTHAHVNTVIIALAGCNCFGQLNFQTFNDAFSINVHIVTSYIIDVFRLLRLWR